MGEKSKQKLERACEGGGWLTLLPISQYGTDISREEFRDALQWILDITLQDPLMACNGCSDPFTVDHTCCYKRGGLVVLQNNLLNKEEADMYGVEYTPDTVTNEPKIHGVTAVG